jgi:arylsulfatase A-like enzyme
VLPLLLWIPLALLELVSRPAFADLSTSLTLRRAFVLALLVALAIAGVMSVVAHVAARVLPSGDAHARPTRAGVAGAIAAVASALLVLIHRSVLPRMAAAGLAPEMSLLALTLACCAAASVVVNTSVRLRRGDATVVASTWGVGSIVVWIWVVAVRFGVHSVDARAAWMIATAAIALGAVILPWRRTPMRRAAFCGAFLAACAVPTASGFMPPAMPQTAATQLAVLQRRPNVVMVWIDTLRADHTGPGLYEAETTPALQSLLGQRATWFSTATAQASSTIPSMKSLFTSRPATYLGDEELNKAPHAEAWTIAQAFKGAGYRTAGVTANELLADPGFSKGFDQFWAFGGYSYFRRSMLLSELLSGSSYLEGLARMKFFETHKEPAPRVVEFTREWLRGDSSGPFFLYVHLLDPHWPYYARGYDLIPADVRAIDDPFSFVELLALEPGDPRNGAIRGDPRLTEMVGRYDEEIRFADDAVRSLLDELRALDLDDTTLVVIGADHGEEFLEHDGFGHGHDVFQEQVHVPLVFRWPARPKYATFPARVTTPVSLMDVLPTLTDFLRLQPPPYGVAGASLRPLLEGRQDTWTPVVTESYGGRTWRKAYREGDLKVRISHATAGAVAAATDVEVYDLASDPAERHPLDAGDARVAPLVERARRHLARHQLAM